MTNTLTAEQMQDGAEYTVTFRGKYIVLDNELVQGTGMVINDKIAFMPFDLAASISSLPSPPVSGGVISLDRLKEIIQKDFYAAPMGGCTERLAKAIQDELRLSPLTNEPVGVTIPKTLKDFGYAPGKYMVKCLDCGEQDFWLDKRAWRCEKCAQTRLSAAIGEGG